VEFEYLDVLDVIEMHAELVERYGGDPGLRDPGLLSSAVESVRATFDSEPLITDLFEAAAAYLFQVALNHPFVDGNKRTAAAAAILFLELNGWLLKADESALAETVLTVARGELKRPGVADFLRKNSVTDPSGPSRG
jgi:death on curing protein